MVRLMQVRSAARRSWPTTATALLPKAWAGWCQILPTLNWQGGAPHFTDCGATAGPPVRASAANPVARSGRKLVHLASASQARLQEKGSKAHEHRGHLR